MYCDNYLKNNQTFLNFKHENTGYSNQNALINQNLEFAQQTSRPYVNTRYGQYANHSNTHNQQTIDEGQFQPKAVISFHQNNANNLDNRPYQFNSTLPTDFSSQSLYKNTEHPWKQKQEFSFLNQYKTNQAITSPKNIPNSVDNIEKGSFRTGFGLQNQVKNTVNNPTGYEAFMLENKVKMMSKEKYSLNINEKPNYNQSLKKESEYKYHFDNSQLKNSGFQNINKLGISLISRDEEQSAKNLDSYSRVIEKSEDTRLDNESEMYKFELKNSSFNDQSKVLNEGQSKYDFKFYTPLLIKKAEQEKNTDLKNKDLNINRVSENHSSKRATLPIESNKYRNHESSITIVQPDLNYRGDLRNNENQIQIQNNPIYKVNDTPKDVHSEKSILSDVNSVSSPKNNYHTLIQNLEKKFSEKQKQSQVFENKEKKYLNELLSKDSKIKEYESLLKSKQETVNYLEQSIKQIRKKNELRPTNDSNHVTTIQQLKNQVNKLQNELDGIKKQNNKLNEQNKNLKKTTKDSTNYEQYFVEKQKLLTYESQINELNNKMHELAQMNEISIKQISKLRESNSQLHLEYNQQLKLNQKSKQEITVILKEKESLLKNLEIKSSNFDEIIKKYDKVKKQFEDYLKRTNIIQDELEKLRLRNQKFEAEISVKNMKIKQYEEGEGQKNANSPLILSFKQQFDIMNEKIKTKQEVNEQLLEQLHAKTKQIQNMVFQKCEHQIQIFNLQNQIKTLKQIECEKKVNQEVLRKFEDHNNEQNINYKQQFDKVRNLLRIYHNKYDEIASLFNLSPSNQEKMIFKNEQKHSKSMKCLPIQCGDNYSLKSQTKLQNTEAQPSGDYLLCIHVLLKDEIQKIHKDLKKMVSTMKQHENQLQSRNLKLNQLDKILKKQGGKINSFIQQIHNKNQMIQDLNKMQLQSEIYRLNEKFQILNKTILQEI